MRHLSILACLGLLVGCGSASAEPGEATETTTGDETMDEPTASEATDADTSDAADADRAVPEDEGPIAEVPFPWTEIRDATPAGRTLVFQFREGGRVRYERWVFTDVSPEGYRSTSTPVDENGAPTGEPEEDAGTWQQLEHHAHFPADATEITNAVLTLPSGRYRCRLYTVTAGDAVQRFWFATDQAGPPVRMVREVRGETVIEMQIVSGS
ncbi:MAG: hypothetical protein H6719_35030 [Sandaracinaceae bacterium]|nr:hypothetical protein [Sandaracinaceae bacterium]